jgi:hypothetical protein
MVLGKHVGLEHGYQIRPFKSWIISMNYLEIDYVIASLESVERFFRKIMTREPKLSLYGFQLIESWSLYEEVVPILRNIESLFRQLIEFSRVVDRTSCELIQSTIESGDLLGSIGRVYIRLRIEIERWELLPYLPVFWRIFNMITRTRAQQHSFFSDFAEPIQEILFTLNRLISQADSLKSVYINKLQSDDELFRPSSVDRKIVVYYIEKSAMIIQSASLGAKEKKELLETLENTKVELAKINPSWKKIVGALVIVATLLGGLADTPQAYENVSKAIQYILGASVEHHLPKQLLPLPEARGGASI